MKKLLLSVLFVFILAVGTAYATPVTYEYSGHFYYASGGSNLGISNGTTFTGTFTYEDTQPLTLDGNYFCDYTLTINGYTVSKDDSRIHVHDFYSWDYLGVYAEDFSGDQELTTAVNSVKMIFLYTDLFPDASLPGSELTLNDFSSSGLFYLKGDSSRFIGYFDSLSSGNSAPAPAPVPEPATIFLLGTGLVGMTGYARKKQAKK